MWPPPFYIVAFRPPFFATMLHAYKVDLKTQLADFFILFFLTLGIKCKKQPLECLPSCKCEIWKVLFSGDLTDGAKCNFSQCYLLFFCCFAFFTQGG